jgi:hypothetical protein
MRSRLIGVGEFADWLQRALIVFCVVLVLSAGAMLNEFATHCLAFVSIVEVGFMTWRRLK